MNWTGIPECAIESLEISIAQAFAPISKVQIKANIFAQAAPAQLIKVLAMSDDIQGEVLVSKRQAALQILHLHWPR